MKLLICSIFSLLALTSIAQQKVVSIGIIKDSVTREIIPFTAITNLNNNKTVISNKAGLFYLNMNENHLLSFAAVGYYFDTIRINKEILQKDSIHIYLKPITKSLESVTVYSKIKYNAYQKDSIKRREEFFINKSDYAIPTFSNANSGAGLGFNLDHFYGREKKKRRVVSLFDKMEQEQYINYRYTPQLVNEYTQLNDDALSDFIQQSRPSYNWLRKHVEQEDIVYYINDQLKLFQKKK